jgi:signal transduction histidine kinase/signal recognition particle receptor subunit beta
LAQWSHADRTLYAKLVYYGPAMGGKTTNLQSLHRITDPESQHELLSVNTSDDRTLFFDLLPFNLGSILGYKVAMKIFTVPGQVRYDVTRRVVLAGADAVVFVADSARGREQDNRTAVENLRANMKANRLDVTTVPVLFQYNKQDLADAAAPADVASWLGIEPSQGFPAVATIGDGVLETFMAASQRMLERLVAFADTRTRRELNPGELSQQMERAFAPHLARHKARGAAPAPSSAVAPPQAPAPIVAEGDGLLEQSVSATLRLGGDLASERERGSRLEREAESFRRLSEGLLQTGARFDPDAIVDGALDVAGTMVGAAGISLVREARPGQVALERAWKLAQDPLLGFAAGRALAGRMLAASGPSVVEDLGGEIGGQDTARVSERFRSVASVPLEGVPRRWLLAYKPAPDGEIGENDVRFLATVAAHLAVGFDKARVHAELEGHRKRLEEIVHARTGELKRAYENLRSLDQVKDRFLSSLSHEMRTPLTAVLSAATFLRDYEGTPEERGEMIAGILEAGRNLERLLENVFRVTRLEGPGQKLEMGRTRIGVLVAEALRVAGSPQVAVEIKDDSAEVSLDLARAARAVANLVDNALKFSPPGSPVEVRAARARLKRGETLTDGVAVSVLDRGPGVEEHDLERIFAPFEQGGEILTSKPSGVGLGLHEARTIARLHGGALRYLSRPGGGAEFRLVLPLEPVPTEGALEVAIA